MVKLSVLGLGLLFCLVFSAACAQPGTPGPTAALPTFTAEVAAVQPTATATRTPTLTASPSPTNTPAPTNTPTATFTWTPTSTRTSTPTRTPTLTKTLTPTRTPTRRAPTQAPQVVPTQAPPPTEPPVAENPCQLQPGQAGILFENTRDFRVLLTIGGGDWGTHDYWFEPMSTTPIQFPPGRYTATLTLPGLGNYRFADDRIDFQAGSCTGLQSP